MTLDVNCVFLDMPCTIKAYTICNPDMTYTIVLNSRLSREQHLVSYHHEMKHIENGDYDKRCDVGLLEIVAHREGCGA